jgi:hypothetical protein
MIPMRRPSIFKKTDVTPAGLRLEMFALDEMSKRGGQT